MMLNRNICPIWVKILRVERSLVRDSKLNKYWWRYSYLLKLNTVLSGAVLVNATSGYDGSLLNGLQSLPQWADYLGNPAGYILGTMTSGITFGTIISMSFISWLCDKFGLRRPIIGGSFVIILGAIVQSTAQNYAMYVAGRFIIGISLGIVATAAPLLISEAAYPAHRAPCKDDIFH